MSEPTYPAVIDTLGQLFDHGMGAFMACPTCLKAGCGESNVEVRITAPAPSHPNVR